MAEPALDACPETSDEMGRQRCGRMAIPMQPILDVTTWGAPPEWQRRVNVPAIKDQFGLSQVTILPD